MKRNVAGFVLMMLSATIFSVGSFAGLSESVKNYCQMQGDPDACIKRQKELDENLKRSEEYNKAIKKEHKKDKD